MICHIDFESRSAADLKKVGSMRYAQAPTTEVLCAAYRFDDGPVNLWKRGDTPPQDLIDAVAAGATVAAHNAMFELAIWTFVCEPRMGWGKLSPHQCDCTMARAHVMSLLGSLDGASKLLRLAERKDQDGGRLIRKFCIPRKPAKGEDPDAILWNAPEGEDFDRLLEYCRQDVIVECALDKALPPLTDSERDVFHFDLTVNLRGFRLDTAIMRKADAFLQEAKKRIDAELNRVTDGAVPKATQVAKLKEWLAGRGIIVEKMGKGEIDDILERIAIAGDEDAESAVTLRRLGAKATSLAKYGSGLRCVGFDERARGLLTYHKASTGRWAGSLYQPHNLERIDPETDEPLIQNMLRILREAPTPQDAVDWCELLDYQPMRAIGKCTRAMIVAAPGHELIGADYSGVEARGSAWLAGEQWKIDAFLAYDAGTGPNLYKVAYGRAFGEDPESFGKGLKYSIGKCMELFLGYQGSVGAFMAGSANFGFKPAAIRDAVKPAATAAGWDAAAARYENRSHYGLDADTWTALQYVVDGWRAAHARTVQCWWNLQDAVVEAVSEPGQTVYLFDGKVRVYCARNRSFMYVYLPSGRALSYFRPRVKDRVDDFGRTRHQVIVEGWDSRRNKWGDVALYGGILWENIVQAMCRDLLCHGMMTAERNGYPVVLHVHDEGVFEVPIGEGDVEEVRRHMAVLPRWARGFPLTSAAWRDPRYVK